MASLSGCPILRVSFGSGRRSTCRRRAAPADLFASSASCASFAGSRLAWPELCSSGVFRVGLPRASAEAAPSQEVKRERGVVEDVVAERPLNVGIVCGGPSAERGVSLNSARSVLDHVQGEDLHVSCYYIDCDYNAYAISPAQLYSNTPADFDFKLKSLAQGFDSLTEFAEHLATFMDIVFPVIHGQFGEDGGLQELLEKANVPFVGTPSAECRQAFDKYKASIELSKQGFVTVPGFLIQENQIDKTELARWFDGQHLDKDKGKVVVKPTKGGSSLGVCVAYGVYDSIAKAVDIISEGIDDKVLVERFLDGGSEFTAVVIDVGNGSECRPVALLPSEVELCGDKNVNEDTIFNYRRKYLPTHQVAYHTPPRFPSDVIEYIRQGAALLFKSFKLRDFARIDGWFFPSPPDFLLSSENKIKYGKTKSGTIIFTDINLVSGMEQTSFLFQQASKVGFSHSNILRTVIQHACLRFPSLRARSIAWNLYFRRLKSRNHAVDVRKQKVFVIFGGETSERQVSLMSGTNVWLNLQGFDDLDVLPCMLAPAAGYTSSKNEAVGQATSSIVVWSLPYSLVLRHTTEEVFAACAEAIEPDRATSVCNMSRSVMNELLEALSKHDWFMGFDIIVEPPAKLSLDQWIIDAKEARAIVFIAVHGGIGEDGTLQSLLEDAGIPYTGPSSGASNTCMDKVSTSLALAHLRDQGILTLPKELKRDNDIIHSSIPSIWNELTTKLQSETLCVKPARDGCSTGVARLRCEEDLKVYVNALERCLPRLPANSLSKAHGVIEMPIPTPELLIFEPFVKTDEIIVSSKSGNSSRHLMWEGQSEWVEVTVGVIGTKGQMRSLSPSITVKETGDILSLEEKFQGGTGINLTPPPAMIMSDEALQNCKQRIEIIANTLGLEGFSRIDAFVNIRNGEVLVIEVNTVPGMTPSTVLIHQALAENPPIYPRQFFRALLDLALKRST
ncbi:hypothetical protein AXF42_Ash003532 [Apostasia shenzhenica]|uniref:ATP-grasp domain-containing protein n=1 Tax=Apostasia shenzhenica TaxID=1088818 RepID=A0A2I0BGE8_9ASPA|nr:hypothetical protein AXF42_Ash003532 [Apostasia shenzhenica]